MTHNQSDGERFKSSISELLHLVNSDNNSYSHINVYGAVISCHGKPLWEFTRFIWWMKKCRVAISLWT